MTSVAQVQRGRASEPVRVTVVIPNWNGLVHLDDCMAALRQQRFRDFRVVVIDNASTDGSLSWLAANAPDAEAVRMSENGGFSVAVNEGIRRTESEYVALLNNDTAAAERWLERLVQELDSHPNYDIAASRMVYFDAPGVINATGDTFKFSKLAMQNRGRGDAERGYTRSLRVLGACAGAALYRRSLFDTIGLFDEDFFLIHEDSDLNMRALLAGRKCLYVPDAVVRHKENASTRKHRRSDMQHLGWRNQATVLTKNLPAPVLLLCVALWPWALFRTTVPLRPDYWVAPSEIAQRVALFVRAQTDGARRGLAKRHLRTRANVGSLTVMRWLLHGTGRP
ncbi:MAG: glycosyltransferase family 2 protein [Deltaproteobacteria bacterium]|nr:glycosyltransferase family 2 protein [Deltaproteobacteria bacterium]